MAATLRLGYWAAQEQYDPQRLLQYAMRAEVVGFDIIVTSDHFHPWGDTGGQAGFPWIWLASAAEKTRKVELGTAVTTPMYRYHPALVAQAFATLDNLYPGRIFITIGTGHAMNEIPLGFKWPEVEEKIARLQEALDIIQKLWKGDFVTYEGKYFQLNKAKLYTKPKTKIPVYLATSNERVARIAGQFCDGILTNPRGLDRFNKIVGSMERSAKKAGRDPSTLSKSMEFKVAYDIDYNRALKSAMFWATTAIPAKNESMFGTHESLRHSSDPRKRRRSKTLG